MDYGHELRFGLFPTPDSAHPHRVLDLALLAEEVGLDLVTVQDHPYTPMLDAWTLLSVVAARTHRVTVAPNVANLPLRNPTVLARSAATLDLLSGGRVELGLGAGGFHDAIAAAGGPRLTPGESVDALEEGIAILRGIWQPTGSRAVRVEGTHHRAVGIRPGPAPAHDIGIWVGALKPRMLRLTGRLADGWLPSSSYAPPEVLDGMSATIDEAAERAGRSPRDITRLYNLMGSFERGGPGFPTGTPAEWVEQLAGLTLEVGTSTYILASDDPQDIRRFAAEVAPGVRELVAAEREARYAGASPAVGSPGHEVTGPGTAGHEAHAAGVGDGGFATAADPATGTGGPTAPGDRSTAGEPGVAATASTRGSTRVTTEPGAAAASTGRAPLAVTPTPDTGIRLSPDRPWDEARRPTGPAPDPDRLYTPHEQASGRHLVDVHDGLRRELEQVRDIVEQVIAGRIEVAAARSAINESTMRQNNWTAGVYCAQYCRVVTTHHAIEDQSVFPHLRARDGRLAPVLDRLEEEHRVIHEVLDGVDAALVAFVSDPDGARRLTGALDRLSDALLSHLSYEERELVEPLARLGFS